MTPVANLNNGKVPPNAKDIEEAILGALLLEKNAINELPTLPSIDDFYNPAHQEILQSILNLNAKNSAIDIITVKEELKRMGKLEYAGGAWALAELTSKVNSSANIEHHYYILKEHSLKRKLLALGQELINASVNDSKDVFDILDVAQKNLQNATSSAFQASDRRIFEGDEVAERTLNSIKENMKKKQNNEAVGISTGLKDLDNIIGGFRGGQLVLVAARPSMGKTALSLQFVLSAITQGKKVLFFSLEMTNESIFNRLLAMKANELIESNNQSFLSVDYISIGNLETGEVSTEQFVFLQKAKELIQLHNLFIMDGSKLTNQEFSTLCHAQKAKTGLDMVISDYIQLKTGDKEQRKDLELGSISRNSKQVAKKLNVCVIELAQLNRGVEQRERKIPMLSDLKNSGNFEEDADLVMMLYRPEYYGEEFFEDGATHGHSKLGIYIRKQRSGRVPSDPIIVNYFAYSNQFSNLHKSF